MAADGMTAYTLGVSAYCRHSAAALLRDRAPVAAAREGRFSKDKIPLWPWFASGPLVGAGTAAPLILRPVYRAWMRFGLLMSRVTTPPLREARAYRVASTPRSAQDLERPF